MPQNHVDGSSVSLRHETADINARHADPKWLEFWQSAYQDVAHNFTLSRTQNEHDSDTYNSHPYVEGVIIIEHDTTTTSHPYVEEGMTKNLALEWEYFYAEQYQTYFELFWNQDMNYVHANFTPEVKPSPSGTTFTSWVARLENFGFKIQPAVLEQSEHQKYVYLLIFSTSTSSYQLYINT